MQNPITENNPTAGWLTTEAGSILSFEIDLTRQASVNIDLMDEGQTEIPLHLSMRREAGSLVVNQRGAAGWRRELELKARLDATHHDLQLVFERGLFGKPAVTIWLDGQRLKRLDSLPRPEDSAPRGIRRGFPALAKIATLNWPLGVCSVRQLKTTFFSEPVLTERLELLWNPTQERVLLDLENGEDFLEFLPLAVALPPQMRHLQGVMVPGRIWHDVRGESASVTVHAASTRLPITLTKSAVLDCLCSAQAQWQMQHDPVVRLNMVEHVHYAELWERLPRPVHEILAATARRIGFAVRPTAIAPIRSPVMTERRVTAAEVGDLFHEHIADNPTDDPFAVLDALIRKHGQDAAEVRQLALMLCEWFCLQSDPIQLEALAARHGVKAWEDRANAWASVAGLPMLWAQGNWSAIEAALRTYPRHSKGWLVTPALGWIASALASNRPDRVGRLAGIDQRVGMMTSLLDLTADLAPSYWAQTPCTRLIAGVLDILSELPNLPDWCSHWYIEQTVKTYGLCPEFWDQFDRRDGLQAHPTLAQTARAFVGLQNALTHTKGAFVWEAARPFLLRRCAGHDMLRRTLFNASGLSGVFARRPDLSNLSPVLTQEEIDEAALRWLSLPRSQAARDAIALRVSDPVHMAACRGLRHAARRIPRPAMTQSCIRLATGVHTAMSQLRTQGKLATISAHQICQLALATANERAGFVGLAALLALAECAARQGAETLARDWINAFCQQLDQPGNARALRAHALELALKRFVTCCPDKALRRAVAAKAGELHDMTVSSHEDPHAARLRDTANPFADTLVALITCRQNLATRARESHTAWAPALERLGIPLITVVGRPEGKPAGSGPKFDGKLLELDAPDSYEGLPQKILALTGWVLDHTRFARVLKIDDDCFLNAEAYFNDPTFLTLPYYGRPLYRAPGAMDRTWHMSRSRTERGRLEVDKSPEPSCYADGSTGYLLSRPALEQLSRIRATTQGRRLEQVSFMEDKLVGDLLAQAGVAVAGPNYDVAIFRKTTPGLPHISQYENSFLPFAGSAIKLAHLDAGGEVMEQASKARDCPWPRPTKVWPSMIPAQTGWARNALELVSPPERLEQAREAKVAVVAVMRNECFMLSHFLEHYRRLGVGAFLIVDNGSDDGTLEQLLAEPDVSVFVTDTPYKLSSYGVQWQEALLAHFRPGRWTLLADADELAFWQLPDQDGCVRGNLPDLLSGPDFMQAEAVRMLMLDLYPEGPLSEAQFKHSPFLEAGFIDRAPLRNTSPGQGPWSNSPTLTSALRHRLMSELGAPARANLFVAQKYALLRYQPFMRLSAGLHYITGARLARCDLAFAHFKYHAAFLNKAETEVSRGQHYNNAEEYRAYLALRAEARDTLFDPDHSVPLAQSPTVQEICNPHTAVIPNSGGMVSRSSRTKSAMICARAGAIAKPILNPPLKT